MKAAMQAIENENMQYARRRWLILTTVAIAPYDAGVAAATINVGQQAGGSIGTSLLNTMVASATASYLASHLHRGTILAGHASAALVQQSLVHGYVVGFWWTAGIFAAGAVVCGTLLRRGPLRPRQAPAATVAEPRAVHSEPPSVLHDGAQQRLVSPAQQLPAAQMAVPPGAGELVRQVAAAGGAHVRRPPRGGGKTPPPAAASR